MDGVLDPKDISFVDARLLLEFAHNIESGISNILFRDRRRHYSFESHSVPCSPS